MQPIHPLHEHLTELLIDEFAGKLEQHTHGQMKHKILR